MSTWIYSGSFDPVTLGHLDILQKASRLCDTLIVAIAINPDKQGCFSLEERKAMLERCTGQLPNVRVEVFHGLLVEQARRSGACVIVRGIRTYADWEYENQLCEVNRRLAPELQTLYLPCDPQLSYISSSIVREMARHQADLTHVVPAQALEAIRQRFQP
ncbi:MAG: pantetheine-phosphate adenylyltransferase [Eubacteriales bacterium]|nr:pantetheine-phosphate adenylyltransferase [Eubacteriales bacterium]